MNNYKVATMKAMVFRKYGSPDVLHLEDVKKPSPSDNEVLIKVKAASINEWDWSILTAKMFANRMMFGLFKPKKMNILGADVAGRIEAVGRGVENFQVGDEVFGDLSDQNWGGLAEYVCAPENSVTLKSPNMTFEEAAAIPQAGLLALQSFDHHGSIGPRKKVLINGGGGGVGTFAIQIAKGLGAEVTGVDNAGKMELMRSIGADHVIDHTKEDFTKNGQNYDHIIEVVGSHKLSEYRHSLAENGVCSMVGGSGWLMLWAHIFGSKGTKKIGLMMYDVNKGLDRMKELFESGKVKPVIDKCYSLKDAAEAFRYYGTGDHKGKIVVTMK